MFVVPLCVWMYVGNIFGNNSKEKTLLFFVIRDHIGATPLSNLSNTLRSDLEQIWRGLSKVFTLLGISNLWRS